MLQNLLLMVPFVLANGPGSTKGLGFIENIGLMDQFSHLTNTPTNKDRNHLSFHTIRRHKCSFGMSVIGLVIGIIFHLNSPRIDYRLGSVMNQATILNPQTNPATTHKLSK